MEFLKLFSPFPKRAIMPIKSLFFGFSPPMPVEAKDESRSKAFVMKQPDRRVIEIREVPKV